MDPRSNHGVHIIRPCEEKEGNKEKGKKKEQRKEKKEEKRGRKKRKRSRKSRRRQPCAIDTKREVGQ